MEFTFFIYFILLVLAILLGRCVKIYYTHRSNSALYFAVIPFIIFCVIEGCRYEVGTDWESYVDIYEASPSIIDSSIIERMQWIEPLYLILNSCIRLFNAPYQYLFGVASAIQLIFICLSFRKIPKYLPLGLFLWVLTDLLASQNIIRQYISISIALYGVTQLAQSNSKGFLSCSIVSSLFHYSSVIITPFIVISHRIFNFLDKRIIAITLFVVSFFAGLFLTNIIQNLLPMFTSNEKYLGSMENLDITHEYNSGLGLIFRVFTNILIIYYSPKIINALNLPKGDAIYRVFLIGVCLQNAFANSMYLGRVSLSLTFTKVILLPILIKYLFSTNIIGKSLGIIIIAIYILGFVMTINSGAQDCTPFILKMP